MVCVREVRAALFFFKRVFSHEVMRLPEQDSRITFFVRVEARGGAPLSWASPEAWFFGATVSVEAFAWDLTAGWWTIPELDEPSCAR
jgi:hypothetical protein